MKKLLLFVFAVLAFAACTQNDVEELSANRADVPETLSVGFEGGDDTRIQLNEAQKTVWTKDDLVSVFYRSNANQKWQFQGETGERVGNLRRVSNATATETMHRTVVVYPYNENYYINPETYNIDATLPDVQHYAEGSYGVGENLMVSQSEFTQFSLKNVCGWLKIQLTGNGEKVTSLTLRGNNEEQLAGLIYVDTATAESTLASEMGSSDDNNAGGNLIFDDTIVTELTLDCGEGVELGAEATAFYIAVPPQTFEQGVAVEILCDGYKPMTLATTSEVVIERNHIKPMAAIEFEAEEGEGSEIQNNEIWYTATAKVEAPSDNPWSLDTFGANVVSNEWDSESGEGVITFDANITTIGYAAFYSCDSLTSVTIPDSVTTIGDFTFYYCYNLTSVTIPDSVTTIGQYVFDYCDSLTEFKGKLASEDGRCLIIDGVLKNFAPAGLTSYTIPDGVTAIGYAAFLDCSSLTSITIPDSVTTIEEYGFYACNNLTSITIPDSVTTIENSAFSYCSSITEFNGKFASEDGRCLIVDGTLNSFAFGCGATEYTIPDSVTTIGEYAFSACYNLTSVTIPDSVTTIGNYAFTDCNNLTSISIPDSVTTIGRNTFYNCDSLTSITIPDSVTTIGNYAFYGCDSLTSVTIGDSVTTIGNYVFQYCDSLTSVYCEATTPPSLDENVFEENASDRLIYVPAESVEAYKTADYWSDYANAIVAYDFENGVVIDPNKMILYTATAKVEANSNYPWSFNTFGANILSHDFNEESGEGVITFEDDVTTIGEAAFYWCTNLTSITIPDSVTTIGNEAFYSCFGLTSVTIPDSVTTIGNYAFYDCDSLTSITIPDSVTTIGGSAFCNCNSLTSVTIGDSVTTIGDYAFCWCSNLTSITISDSVTTIGYMAFEGCSSLTSVTIPDSVTTIGSYAFSNCSSLTSITIPDSVTTIGGGAFSGCGSLTEFNGKFASEDGRCLIVDGTLNSFAPADLTSYTIPDSVTTIGEYAFAYCSCFTSITIPDSVTTIGNGAFYVCDSLTSVYCEATTPPSLVGSYVFDDNASERTIYVPAESVDAYKTAERWSKYADYIIGYDFENGVVVE